MKPSEFRAWFDGFTETMKGAPSDAAWDRIKARAKEIDGAPTNTIYPVGIERYVDPSRLYWVSVGKAEALSTA